MNDFKALVPIMERIYGPKIAETALNKLAPIFRHFTPKKLDTNEIFSEKDVILISYADSLGKDSPNPLRSFYEFANLYLKNIFSTLHLLPFFPFSSDDGFSVVDFKRVDPKLGNWEDVQTIGQNFRLMFDYVLNHISSKSQWFQNYLGEIKGFEHLAIEMDPKTDLSGVTRPRALPLLTQFTKKSGKKVHVWTTFSPDQIDLNYQSPDVLEKMVDVMLDYVEKGAAILRLDAIAYLWKQVGTPCIHLPRTHEMVKLFRQILDILAPSVIILTETNVPHEENISYFGNGKDEAQMVYNFTLPPLLLYSFIKENAELLSKWAQGLDIKSDTNTFFNFTASHDGIGVRPLEGILPKSEIDMLCEAVKNNGGHISYKQNTDGTQSPYELNITYVDALCNEKSPGSSIHIKRFLASQAIMYVMPGVPATYIHSLVGSHNWPEGVKCTGRLRTINREKLNLESVLEELNDKTSFRSKIFSAYIDLIKKRTGQPAFHPKAGFEILDLDKRIFAIRRFCSRQTLVCLTNISGDVVNVYVKTKKENAGYTDIISRKWYKEIALKMDPYEYLWLERKDM